MTQIVADRVLESTTTTGTGALALAGAVTGFRRFNAVCAVADTVDYFIEAIDSVGQPTGDYEYGTGTYSAANQLTRTTVRGSSNAGAAVNFAAGSKNVGLCELALRRQPQTTQNLLASRALSTPYTNNTGQPIFVHVRAISSAVTPTSLSFIVGGITFAGVTITVSGSGTHLSAMVPDGATYQAILSGTGALSEWIEVR